MEVFLLQSCVSAEMIGLLYGANGAEFTSFLLSNAADSPGMFVQAHPAECLLHGETGGRAKDGDEQREMHSVRDNKQAAYARPFCDGSVNPCRHLRTESA